MYQLDIADVGEIIFCNFFSLQSIKSFKYKRFIQLVWKTTHGEWPDLLLNEFGADYTKEGGRGLVGDGLGQQGLPGPGGTVQYHALDRLGSTFHKKN